jgi:hypothetical protein
MSVRDENRHLDIKREVSFRMSALIDRHWTHYGVKKLSASREKSVLDGIRSELGRSFVREVDGDAVGSWYENLTAVRDLSPGTALRHFNVMHHMMEQASTIWSKDTGIDRNPADQVEVRRPDDQRDRYLSEEELRQLKRALDEKMYRKGYKNDQQDVLSFEADRAHRCHHGNAGGGNLWPWMVGRDVQRGAVGGEGKAEGRENALRPDASRTRRRAAAVSRGDGRRSDFSARTGRNERTAACGREFRRPA